MGFLGWIVVGLIAGTLAAAFTGIRGSGCLTNIALGIVGGLLGGILFNAAGSRGIGDFGLWSIFVAFVGAFLLALIVRLFQRPD